MATQKEREEFIARFVKEFSGKVSPAAPPPGYEARVHTLDECIRAARLLLRHAKTHARLAEESCNGHPAQSSPTMPTDQLGKLQDAWDARIKREEERTEKRIREICAAFSLAVHFGGDPRGYTVKLKLPSGTYNSWGGSEDGYGVPS